jgi:hypothetical protein
VRAVIDVIVSSVLGKTAGTFFLCAWHLIVSRSLFLLGS